MAGTGDEVRRVSVCADGHTVDVTLPAAVPIIDLMSPIVDLLRTRDGFGAVAAIPTGYQLSHVGGSALDASSTLQDNAIHNGALLLLTSISTRLSEPSFDDAAEAVAATLAGVVRPWTPQFSRLTSAGAAMWLAGLGAALLVARSSGDSAVVAVLTGCLALAAATLAHRIYREPVAGLALGLIAAGFASFAGFLAVPGEPGPPNVLLAAMAGGVVVVLALRLTGCGPRTFTALCCVALLISGAAVTTVAVSGPLPMLGSLSTVASLTLMEVSPRLAVTWAGLSPRLPDYPDIATSHDALRPRAVRAEGMFTSLVVAAAVTAAAGATCSVFSTNTADGNRLAAGASAAVTGAVLLLRARRHPDLTKTLTLLVAGTTALSAAYIVVAAAAPSGALWTMAGIAAAVAGALCLGFAAPAVTVSPVARRSVDLLEYVGLIAIVPLACWTGGLFTVARGVRLT